MSVSACAPPPPPEPLASEALATWPEHLAEVSARLRTVFRFRRTHRRALAYIEGLMSTAPRKNSWQLAEVQGEANPYGFQHLLGRAAWSPDAGRDALQAYVVDHLADTAGVGIIDETGFLKKGVHSAGVARQYSGTAGRIENCQVGVYLAYAGARGTVLVDRALYLPKAWTTDPARLQAVGLAPDTPLATKPELAWRMLARALEDRAQAYVLAAVAGHEKVWWGWRQPAVSAIHATLAEADWRHRSAEAGSKGERWYEWQWVRREVVGEANPPAPRVHSLLFRRSCKDPDGLDRLPGLRPPRHGTGDRGAGGRHALVHRERLRGRQAGGGPGRVRGAQRHRLVPAHDPGPAGRAEGDHAAGGVPRQKKPTGSLAAFRRSCGLAWA